MWIFSHLHLRQRIACTHGFWLLAQHFEFNWRCRSGRVTEFVRFWRHFMWKSYTRGRRDILRMKCAPSKIPNFHFLRYFGNCFKRVPCLSFQKFLSLLLPERFIYFSVVKRRKKDSSYIFSRKTYSNPVIKLYQIFDYEILSRRDRRCPSSSFVHSIRVDRRKRRTFEMEKK